jgi:hypothetical protein
MVIDAITSIVYVGVAPIPWLSFVSMDPGMECGVADGVGGGLWV